MGKLRLILAITVASSHAGLNIEGFNLGVIAVTVFLIISGFSMGSKILKSHSNSQSVVSFYKNRLVRIVPQFLFYLLVSTFFIRFAQIDSQFIKSLNPSKWLLNLAILPLGYNWYLNLQNAIVIPQSWTLGLELTFYILIPWLMLGSVHFRYAVGGISLIIFIFAFNGIIDTDLYGYRLLPGTLFIFLSGTSIAESQWEALIFRRIILLVSELLGIFLFKFPSLAGLNYNKEVVIGLILGLLIIPTVKNCQKSKIDLILGNCSYGVYLNHFIFLWWLRKIFKTHTLNFRSTVLLIMLSSVGALVSYLYIEKPIANYFKRKTRFIPNL